MSKCFKILDTEDLHSLRKGRHQAFKDNAIFDKSYLFNDTAKREIASIYTMRFNVYYFGSRNGNFKKSI